MRRFLITSALCLAAAGALAQFDPMPGSRPHADRIVPHQLTASLTADVPMNVSANYFDGPSVAQGTIGTWFASGTVTLDDTGGTQAFFCKMWDGTNLMATSSTQSSGATTISLSLSGIIAAPIGNIRISCREPSATAGKILFNITGNSKDSTISAYRIK